MPDSKYGRLFTTDDVQRILRYGGDSDWSEIMDEFDGPGGRGLTFPADEPLFLLRGKDHAAATVLRDYVSTTSHLGSSEQHVTAAYEAQKTFEQFADEHPDRMKVADRWPTWAKAWRASHQASYTTATP